jgi:pimeloyl-ACP methyl ester carboxylesterase
MTRRLLSTGILAALFGRPIPSQAQPKQRLGIVLLHGIGATGAAMEPLAARWRAQGWTVSTPDLPYGGNAAFSRPVAEAERIVREQLHRLRREGAQKVVLAGFSIGGFFAAHMAGREPVDALVAIAPNGGADMKQLQDEVARARQLVAQGRGDQPTTMKDGAVVGDDRYDLPGAVPSAWLTWFDPAGAMNWRRVWQALRPGVPVFLVVPTRDLANLRKVKRELWEGLPRDPRHQLYEPRSDHLGAPLASADESIRWIRATVEAAAPSASR